MITSDSDYQYGEVPKSQGVAPLTLYIIFAGIIGIMLVGYDVISFSHYGHVWPAAQSQRIDLNSSEWH